MRNIFRLPIGPDILRLDFFMETQFSVRYELILSGVLLCKQGLGRHTQTTDTQAGLSHLFCHKASPLCIVASRLIVVYWAVPWLRPLFCGLPPRGSWADPGPLCYHICGGQSGTRHVWFCLLQLSPLSIISVTLHILPSPTVPSQYHFSNATYSAFSNCPLSVPFQ